MDSLTAIAYMRSDFPSKFGIPRQSGIVETLESRIVFEPEYRNIDALRGLEGFSHVWIIWGFSLSERHTWSPTVRPPRLGGNIRMGVFATRSPFRPNPIGLSCVKILDIREHSSGGPVIIVQGADLMDGSPIYDIKPYIPYTDCCPDAIGGFANDQPSAKLNVVVEDKWLEVLPDGRDRALIDVLALDPRPSYQNEPGRVYGFEFAGCEVKFNVNGDSLTVLEIKHIGERSCLD